MENIKLKKYREVYRPPDQLEKTINQYALVASFLSGVLLQVHRYPSKKTYTP